MEGIKQLQLKANDGKAYQFSTVKTKNVSTSASEFSTIQLARLLIEKFTGVMQRPGADLLAVLGMFDHCAEIGARSVGSIVSSDAKELLAKALFEGRLHAYELPVIDPVTIPESKTEVNNSSLQNEARTHGGEFEVEEVGEDSVNTEAVSVSIDEMTCAGDPVSMVTGEEILKLIDISLSDKSVSGDTEINWQRLYRSGLSSQNVGLGYGWRSNFHFELKKDPALEDGSYQWRFIDQEGRTLLFDDVAPGAISYQLTAGASLLHDRHGYYLLTLNDGRQLRFVSHRERWVLDKLRVNETLNFRFEYSCAGRPIRLKSNTGRELTFRYDAGGYLVEVQAQVNESDEPVVLASYEYDAHGDLIKASNRQQQEELYRYNGHLLIQRTRPSGFSHYFKWQGKRDEACCIAQWGDDDCYQYQFEYDKENHAAISTDSLGNRWRYIHNAKGKLLQKVSPLGNVWCYEYDHHGLKTAEITPDGTATYYRYNDFGQLCEIQAPDKSRTKYHYNRLGQIARIIDGENREWVNDYNSFGRLLSQQSPDGIVKTYQYDHHGRITTVTSSDGQVLQYWWDKQGRLVAAKDRDAVTRYSYDELGELNGIINPDGWVIQYRRNTAGLVTEVIEYQHDMPSNSRSWHLEYDQAARLIASTDPLGRTTSLTYQGLAQPVKQTRPDGSWLAFCYDKERNLTGIERSDGVTYRLEYDGEERITKTVGFDGRVQEYQYDGQGRLACLAEQGERFVKLIRDHSGRVIEQLSATASGIPFSNHYQYDKAGRLVHANNAERKVSFLYHTSGKPAEIWQDNWPIKHEYDSVGRRVLTQLPDGSQIDYRYSETGLLSGIYWQQQQLLSRHFDNSNRENQRHYGNGVSQVQAFNSKGLLVEQSWQQTDGLQQRVYQYDQADQLVGIKDSELGDTRYQFDELKQLIQCTQLNNDVPFTPDSFGNPCGEDIQIEADRLLKWQESQFSYDAYGNQSRVYRPSGHEQRQFNGLNQLTGVKVGGKYTQYQYDALGRRSTKITGHQCTDYLWDGDQLIGEHCNGEFTWYIYEPDGFRPVVLIKKGLVYYYHLDHLGTPLQLTDSQGNVVWQAEYSAYGKANLRVATINNPLRFQGQYFDEETGLHYNRFRYYDPDSGRFIHQDPIGLLGGLNHYQYAPNPVQWIDPLGLSCKEGGAALATAARAVPYRPTLNVLSNNVTKLATQAAANDALYITERSLLAELAPALGRLTTALSALFYSSSVGGELEQYQAADGTVYSKYSSELLFKAVAPGGETWFADNLQDDIKYRTWLANGGDGSYEEWLSQGKPDSLDAGGNIDAAETNYVYFNRTHKDSLPKPKGRGPNGGRLQSHHGLQQQWAKENISEYDYDASLAPSITIETGKGFPHTEISKRQNARRDARIKAGEGKWSSSLQDELQFIVDDMRAAGFKKKTIEKVLQQQYKMLDKLKIPYQKIDY
ncbi:hypothetical protein C942_02404 [Photobacterium marinum]|uniref:Uncharacterized protein n=1 Tax=Photobacterium marinum TaxID=1056511 RepID=L8J721_9GAMM|nr:RHS repeat-associated core domain-containing protein [Photobacterium marinum]ELR64591.1 hypothetical protein C942_02404 [Photobacterium marinum]